MAGIPVVPPLVVSHRVPGDHQRRNIRNARHGGPDGRIFEVDRESYLSFCAAIGWDVPEPFQACIPNLRPRERPDNRRPQRRRPSPPAHRRTPPPSDARARILVRRLAVPAPDTEPEAGQLPTTGPIADTVLTLLRQADLLESSAQVLRRQAQSLSHRSLEYRPPRR